MGTVGAEEPVVAEADDEAVVEAEEAETPPGSEGPGRAAQPAPDQVLGQITTLLLNSPDHRHLFMADWEWLILPALAHRQFRIFRRRGRPFAYVSWAFVSEEVAGRFKAGGFKLRPDEWRSGEECWLVDVICPVGTVDAIVKELKDQVLSDQKIRSIQPAPDGRSIVMVEW